jgi:hypothetical protein
MLTTCCASLLTPRNQCEESKKTSSLKDDKIAELDVYLGATIAKMSLDNGEILPATTMRAFVKQS